MNTKLDREALFYDTTDCVLQFLLSDIACSWSEVYDIYRYQRLPSGSDGAACTGVPSTAPISELRFSPLIKDSWFYGTKHWTIEQQGNWTSENFQITLTYWVDKE